MEKTRQRHAGEADEQSSPGESLSADELQQVLRRAAAIERAESQAPQSVGEPTLELREVERIGVESGLSREAIQRAFVEMRTGGLQPEPSRTLLDRLMGPAAVARQSLSPLAPDDVRRRLESALKDELLHPEERTGPRTTWAPAPGLWATIQRGVNLSGQSAWQHAQIESEVLPAKAGPDVRSIVKLDVRPEGRGAIYTALLPFLCFTLGAALISAHGPATGGVAAVTGAVGLASSGLMAGIIRSNYQRRLKRLRVAIARVLDKLG